MNVDGQLLKGSVSIMVLELLAARDMYGYEIIKELERRSDNIFSLNEGTLYPILHSMEGKGLLESYWVSSKQGRKRKYYSITESGLKESSSKKEQWRKFSGAVNKVLEGYYYA